MSHAHKRTEPVAAAAYHNIHFARSIEEEGAVAEKVVIPTTAVKVLSCIGMSSRQVPYSSALCVPPVCAYQVKGSWPQQSSDWHLAGAGDTILRLQCLAACRNGDNRGIF